MAEVEQPMGQQKLDAVYSAVDELLRAGLFDLVDAMLVGSMDRVPTMSVDKILALLITSRPAEPHLPHRPAFYEKCRDELKARGRDWKKLVANLEHWTRMGE